MKDHWMDKLKGGLIVLTLVIYGHSAYGADITTGLVGHWHLDEPTGVTANDSTGYSNGTLISFPTDNSGRTSGKISGALLFNGTNYVRIPHNDILNPGSSSFSYSMWIYHLPVDSHSCTLWKGGENNSAGFMVCTQLGSRGESAFAHVGDGAVKKTASFGQKSLLYKWSLLTVVINRSDNTLKTFVDGQYTGISSDISEVGPIASTKNLQIGEGSNWLPYKGLVDDVRIYKRALAAEDIAALYDLGKNTASVTILKDPASTGTGTIQGPGINCGSSCVQTLNKQEPITLEALPLTPTSYLASWGNPNCKAGSLTCTFNVKADEVIAPKFRDSAEETKILPAASCNQSDVQAAIDSASNGNTVLVPEGNCTWKNLKVNKPITLMGAGRGKTVITRDPTAGSWTAGIVSLTAPAIVKSMTFKPSMTGNNAAAFSASANGFRITDIEYLGLPGSVEGYFLYSSAYGLVDHCDITGGSGSNELIFVRGALDSWQTPHSLGGKDNLFIEDSYFRGAGYVTDCNSNSRCVVRFNTITGAMKVDGHGKASNSPPRGVRHMEVYHNHWTASGGTWAAVEIRGGGGRFFSNTSDSVKPNFFLTEYSVNVAWGGFNNVPQTPANYPIDDQIGVGQDPKKQASEPVYLWSNRAGGTSWPIKLSWTITSSIMEQIIAANRDYYDEAVSFNGSGGVGVGTLANRPSTCTPGVGYWATDQGNWNKSQAGPDGRLYTCSSSGIWESNYTPYPYPHPLISGLGNEAIDVQYGEISGDGNISLYDAALMARHALGSLTLTDAQAEAADVSGDGLINIEDISLVAKRALGLIDQFPIEQ
jgi:hypothetical protein